MLFFLIFIFKNFKKVISIKVNRKKQEANRKWGCLDKCAGRDGHSMIYIEMETNMQPIVLE